MPLSALLVLPRVDSIYAPSPGQIDYQNNRLNMFSIRHPDGSNTLFATYSFTSHSIVSVNNVILADTSTVRVTVTLTAGVYGFTVSPAGMVFNSAGEPTVTVAYGTYGDFSVYSQSPKYPTATDYEQALGMYESAQFGNACRSVYPLLANQEGSYDVPSLNLVMRSVEAIRNPPEKFDGVFELSSK